MKPASFAYVAPATLDEALAALREHGDDVKPIAGGQSLVPLMSFRFAQIEVLVDLNGVAELAYIRPWEDGLAIGAMTRARDAERSELVAARAPLIPEALAFVGHGPIRNRGTLGGSVAHADPAAEMPAVVCALEASLVLRSLDRDRVVAASDFFVTHLTSVLEPDELLTEIRIPAWPARTGSAFCEHARRHGDFAVVGVAAVVSLDEAGRCVRARVTLSGIADRPVDATELVASVVGHPLDEASARTAGDAVAEAVDPSSDIHASAEFRRLMAGVLTRKALQTAAARAVPSPSSTPAFMTQSEAEAYEEN